MFYVQALSLYRDASDLCRRALKRDAMSDEDAAYFKDIASLVSGRAKTIEDTLVTTVERHLLAKNGITTRSCIANVNNNGANGDGAGDWLRSVLSRCSERFTIRTDPEDVPTTETASISSSSTSSLTVVG